MQVNLSFRYPAAKRARLEARARAAGKTLSDYLRDLADQDLASTPETGHSFRSGDLRGCVRIGPRGDNPGVRATLARHAQKDR